MPPWWNGPKHILRYEALGLNLVEQPLSGLLLLEPTAYGRRARGYFMETFKSDSSELLWKQDNESMSHRGVLRGLHFQRPPHAQAKLVSVVQGSGLRRGRGPSRGIADLRKDLLHPY